MWWMGVAWAVVGGAPTEAGAVPVVALVNADDRVFCTGIVVHPRWVLTAGHCVGDAAAVWGGSDLTEGPDVVHLVMDGLVDDGDDLGLLELDTGITPFPALWGPPIEVGQLGQIDGYGATADGALDVGVLRSASLEVLAADETLLRTFTPGANLCSGDSGAPLSREGALVGVGVRVDPTCLGGAGLFVPAARAQAFVEGLVPAYAPPALPALPTTTGRGCRTAGPPAALWLACIAFSMRSVSRRFRFPLFKPPQG